MARLARKKSETGVYHIMLRGINQQQIFIDSENCEKFLQAMNISKKLEECEILAYCLMGNHVHILLRVNHLSIRQISSTTSVSLGLCASSMMSERNRTVPKCLLQCAKTFYLQIKHFSH